MKYIDLFAGCGGLSLGLHNAGWKGILAIERSPAAFETLKHNLIDKKNHFNWPEFLPTQAYDINDFIIKYEDEINKLENVDLIVGGPPCQGFSTAGKRREDDYRNKLINSYLELVSRVKPKFILFENVKGFTQTFKKNKSKGLAYSLLVKKELERLGYNVYSELLDFSKFGVPQKRTRFILFGVNMEENVSVDASLFFETLYKNTEFFLKEKCLKNNNSVEDAIGDLLKKSGEIASPDTKGFKAGLLGEASNPYQRYIRSEESKAGNIIDSHRFANHRPGTVDHFSKAIHLKQRKVIKDDSRKRIQSLLFKNQPAPTLTTLPDDYIHYQEPRILTVREYARIQTFPDWYEFKGSYTTGGKARKNEVPRYTQIGNAIPPLFGEQCGRVIEMLMDGKATV